MDFSEHEKYHNFMVTTKHMDMLETMPLTEDRLVEYKHYFRVLREHFYDLTRANPEITDCAFRKWAESGEKLMQKLDNDFDVKAYYDLLGIIRHMVLLIFQEDELNDMISSMGIK